MADKKNNEVLANAAKAAIGLLQQPEVQEQIAQAGSAVVAAMKQKNQERAKRRVEANASEAPSATKKATIGGKRARRDEKPPLKQVVAARFGNQKLERRVQNLSENVNLLRGAVGPEAATALGEVESVVERLQVAVTMAGNLPVGKRQKAHWEIDSVLDKVERAVFASVME